jgi:1-acyl-sn-glycerol-3-phosphate acyltransferase
MRDRAARTVRRAPMTPWPLSSNRPVTRVPAWIRTAYEYGVLYGGLLLFGTSIFAWSCCAAVLYLLLPRRQGAILGRLTITALFHGFLGLLKASGIVKCDLSALDALRDQGPLIIAPNHPSLLDAVLIVSRLPRVTCIMKSSIWDNLILGGGARFADYIRDDAPFTMIRSAAATVRAGNQLLMFPEGTRTQRRPINRFKGGFALIAKTAGVPVQTVFIQTNSPFLGKGWPLFRKPEFPLIYRVRLGQRFEVEGSLRSFVTGLECYYQQTLATGNTEQADTSR